jgi:hypothetical protein
MRRFGPSYLHSRNNRLPATHRKALQALAACRTSRMGGKLRHCQHCGHEHVRWHSCRNRHCPRCQVQHERLWVQARLRDLLPVPYFHLVFTIPEQLARHCQQEPEKLYKALFAASADTIKSFSQQRLKCLPGMISVLHTWGQNLHFHPHIHMLVCAGGLTAAGDWKAIDPVYLLPVRALSARFRAKCLDRLNALGQSLPVAKLAAKWVVHAQAPVGTPKPLLLYLARYVYRVAITDDRILGIDTHNQSVTFAYKDYRQHGRRREMTLPAHEFLRRFLFHILPDGFVKVRYYGLFAHARKIENLRLARNKILQGGHLAKGLLASILRLLEPATVLTPTCPRCHSTRLLVTRLPPRLPDRFPVPRYKPP